MTLLDPILYADGALRLTDHGPRGGGLVLVHVPSGRQIDLPYNAPGAGAQVASMIERKIEAMTNCRYEPDVMFAELAKTYSRPKFHPFYHH